MTFIRVLRDEVWLQFRNIVGVLFGFCYIPPSDSQYYSYDSFAAIQGRLKSKYMCNGYVIIGDINTRFGKSVKEMYHFCKLQEVF